MINPKNKISVAVIAVVTVLLLGGAGVWIWKNVQKNQSVACTQEAKKCPDGSYVGRTGPKCEFAPCPNVPSSTDTINRIGTTSTIDIPNWQTYRNEKLGLQMKYPPQFILEIESENQVIFSNQGLNGYDIEILKLSNPKNLSLNNIAKEAIGDLLSFTTSSIQIGNLSGLEIRSEGRIGEEGFAFFIPTINSQEVFELLTYRSRQDQSRPFKDNETEIISIVKTIMLLK